MKLFKTCLRPVVIRHHGCPGMNVEKCVLSDDSSVHSYSLSLNRRQFCIICELSSSNSCAVENNVKIVESLSKDLISSLIIFPPAARNLKTIKFCRWFILKFSVYHLCMGWQWCPFPGNFNIIIHDKHIRWNLIYQPIPLI